MAYVSVPKDLTQVKPKFLFNLTKRQVICFGGGAALGLPLFFLTRNVIGSTPASLLMMLVMLPCFSSLRLGNANHTGPKCSTAKGTSQVDLQISQ